MIDIDNFKDVNDSMGHLAGDSIIMEIARQLRRTFRQDDIIGRVGGDEFHVYMRDVSEIAGIRTRAQSLCSSTATCSKQQYRQRRLRQRGHRRYRTPHRL